MVYDRENINIQYKNKHHEDTRTAMKKKVG